MLSAAGKRIPDVIAPGLQVLFCGINPSLYSAFVGHHFGRPGNRFWRAIFASGFTERLLRPEQDRELLQIGCGLTNLVGRATAAADELSREELLAGHRTLTRKIRRYVPQVVAVLGIGAYRTAFSEPAANLGLQSRRILNTRVWVLPNPSGLNAHFTPGALAVLFRQLREELARRDRVGLG